MTSARIVVVGTGYVGLASGACPASLGHGAVCADADGAFLCVPAPMSVGGFADLRAVEAVVEAISVRRPPRRRGRPGQQGYGSGRQEAG